MDKQNLKEKLYTGQENEQENESQQGIQYKISISSENNKNKLPKMNQNRQINLDIQQHSDQKSIVEMSEKSSNQVQSKFSSFLSKNKSKFSDKIQNQSKNINPSQIQNRSQNKSQQKKIELKNEGTKIINPNLLDIEDNLLTLQKRLNEVYINPNINKIDTFLYKQDQIISNRPRKKSMYNKKQDLDDQYLANDQNKSTDKIKFQQKNQNSNQLNIQQNEKFQQRKLSKQNKNLIQKQENQQQNKKLDLNQIQNKKASIKSIQQLQEALKGLEGYQNNISPTQKNEQKQIIVKEQEEEDKNQINILQLKQQNEKKLGTFEKWEQNDKNQKKKKLFESEISENTLNENFIQIQQKEQDFQILNDDKKDKKQQQQHTQNLEKEVYQDKQQQQQQQQDQQKNEYQVQQDENQNDESFSDEESDIENFQKKKKSQFNDEACQQHANVIFDDVQVENIFFPYQVPADIEFAKKHQKAQYFGIPNTYGDKCKCCQELVKVNKYSIWENYKKILKYELPTSQASASQYKAAGTLQLPQGHKAFIFLNSHDDAIVLQHFYQKNKVKVNKMISTFKNIFKIEQLNKNDISVTFPPGLYTDIMWNKIGIPLKYKSIRRLAIYGTIGIIIIVIDVLAFKFIQQKILYEIEYYFDQMNGKDGENFDISQYIDSLLQQTYFSIIYFMMGQICISSGSLLMKRVLNTTHSLDGDKTNSLLTEQMVMVVVLFVLQLIYLLKPKIEKLKSDRQYKKYVKQLAALRIRQPISDNKYIKEDVYYNSYLKYIQNFDPYFVELINKEMRFQALKYEIQKAQKKKSKKKNSKEKITQLKALQMEEIQKEIQEKVQNQIEKPKKLLDIHNLTQKLTTDALNESIIDCSKNNINPNSSPLRQQSINFEIENLQIKLEGGISEDINKDIEEINLEEFQQKIQNDELDEQFLQGENFENKINELNHKLKLEKIESNYLTEYQRLEQIYQNLQQLRISVQNRFPLLNNDHFKSEINSNDNSIFPNDSDLLDSQKIKSPQNYQQYLQQQQDLEQEEDLTESQTEFKKFIKFFLGRSSPQKRKPKILNEQIRKRDIDIKNADLSLSQVSQQNNKENFCKKNSNSNNLSLFSLIKSKLSGENQQENQQIEKSQKLSKSGLNSKVQENVQENKNRRKSLELKKNELQQQFLKDKQIFS
ncbi:hypothetical protein PPERSA_04909 [Pseudocohnilembus persalinus]|uniref:Transmembrane protein n=1 Tax=Pseudocohnilembus persalinus TaxID=266149 RepID=A0A0V0QJ12_PSEPJ|nr:hypothetical protein PPERSA_04909 [Pseudocohnilembus persalinus]|eukprot:KRX02287.1 hypothetical protein PPERSA_04909 [Pseudocohnilembus persalinus]